MLCQRLCIVKNAAIAGANSDICNYRNCQCPYLFHNAWAGDKVPAFTQPFQGLSCHARQYRAHLRRASLHITCRGSCRFCEGLP